MISSKDKTTARNTVFLYGRTVLTLFLSLYTSRVVLEKLGASDFGVFNLVAGFITIFAFIYGSASSAALRYLSFELGAKNDERLRKTFSTVVALHLVATGIIVLLAETIGLWFVNTQLEIAPERMFAANVVYQTAVLSMVFTIMQVPYSSVLMARERLDVFAIIMFSQSVLRLGVALSITFFAAYDTLIWYSILYMGAGFVVFMAFLVYTRRHYSESKSRPGFYSDVTRQLVAFSGYDLYGNFCSVAMLQGSAVILNRFGGTILNAAAGLATNVTAAFQSFSNTIVLAFKPRMTKEYADANPQLCASLVRSCTRFSFILAGMMMVPLLLEMDYVLQLWLGGEIPPYTADFCRVCVISSTFEAARVSVYSGIHATGKVRSLSLLNGSLCLVELVVMYFLLRLCQNPAIVYITHLCFVIFTIFTATVILRRQMPAFSLRSFYFAAMPRPILIVSVAMLSCVAVMEGVEAGFVRLMLLCVMSLAVCTIGTYCFILNAEMRAQLRASIKARLLPNKNCKQ